MKRSVKTSNSKKRKASTIRLKAEIVQPAKRLSDLVSVYEDLEKTLKGLRTSSLLQGKNSLQEINIKKLITQLSKSKRKIERKISATLVNEKAQMRSQISKWAPRLRLKLGKSSSLNH